MPGSRGRSQGCLTCRQRRVMCDQGRPSCERCRKGFFHCKGYKRPLIFHNFGISDGSQSCDSPVANLAVVQRSFQYPLQAPRTPHGRDSSVPPALHLGAFREELTISYLMRKLFLDLGDKTPPANGNLSWAVDVWNNREQQRTQYLCLSALAAAFFGRVNKDTVNLDYGTKTYCRALSSLVNDLNNHGQAALVPHLLSSLCLGIYELVTSSHLRGWLQHCSGMSAITEAFGPAAYQNEKANSVFCVNRTLISLHAIVERKRCFLEQHRWKTIPWALDTGPRPLALRLQDILCDTPGCFEDTQTILINLARGHNVKNARKSLSDRVLVLVQQLYEIRWQWEEEFAHTCYEVTTELSHTLCLDDGGCALFETVYYFRGILSAVNVANYNALLLLLHNVLNVLGVCQLGELIPPTLAGNPDKVNSTSTTSLILPGQGSCATAALEICRVVDYCLLEEQDSLGALFLLFPLRVAHGILCDSQPGTARWVDNILKEIANSKGFEIGGHILLQQTTPLDSTHTSVEPPSPLNVYSAVFLENS